MLQAASLQQQSVSAAVHDTCAARLLSLLGSAVRAAPMAGKGADAEAGGAAAAGGGTASAEESLAQVSEVIAAAQRSKSASLARAATDDEAAVATTLHHATPAQPGVLQTTTSTRSL